MSEPMKFRTRLVDVEAMQLTRDSCARICQWIGAPHATNNCDGCGLHGIGVRTNHGSQTATPGDWIVLTAGGVWSVCGPVAFDALYDPVVVVAGPVLLPSREDIFQSAGVPPLPPGLSFAIVGRPQRWDDEVPDWDSNNKLVPGQLVMLRLEKEGMGGYRFAEAVPVRVANVFVDCHPPDYVGVIECEPMLEPVGYGLRVRFRPENVQRILPSRSTSSVSPPRAV